MCDIYNLLKNQPLFIENEYLLKYCCLIEQNTNTCKTSKTNAHHILPKSWFKLVNRCIDNSLINLVNLNYRDHVLAHYYLCLCTQDPLRYANQLAFFYLLSRKSKVNTVDSFLIKKLPMYNNIYEEYMIKLKNNYRLYEKDSDNKSNY